MALSSFTVTIITKSDSPFNIIENAPIEIRERLANGSSGGLSLIFSDQAGLNPITQVGFTANSLGQATFFAAAADYNAVYDNNGTPVTIAVDVGVTGEILNERFDRLNPDAIAIAIADATLLENDILHVEEHTSGSGGGALWKVVLASTVTTNGIDIVQCTGAPTLALKILDSPEFNVRQVGARGGIDSTPIFQRGLARAKGADGTGALRDVFVIYAPNFKQEFYKITDTLLIDGTHGMIFRGDGSLAQRSVTNEEAVIRWDGASSLPIIQLKGGAGSPSNPNFYIKLKDIILSGNLTKLDPTATPPANIALAGIYMGALPGDSQNTLLRQVVLDNANISDCRFGIYSDSPDGNNTDHANIVIKNSRLHNNAQQGIHWGTGNAICSFGKNFCEGNGWGADHYPADAFSEEIGANVYVKSGSMNITSYTSTGSGDKKPIDADIYQANGRVNIDTAWSDTHGYFFFQVAATISDGAPQAGILTGIRHFEGGMNDTNTPTSMQIRVPGTVIQGMVRGDIELVSGLAGAPIDLGMRFGAGKGYKGTGVDTQRSLIRFANSGNEAQIFTGGADAGVDFAHVGVLNPQYLQMGIHSAGDTQTRALRQSLGGAATDSGFTEFFDAATGSMIRITNGFLSSTSPFTITPMKIGLVTYTVFGQGAAIKIFQIDSADGSTPVELSAFIVSFEVRVDSASNRVAIAFPQLGSDPSTPSGDFWESCVYYNTGTSKLRLNTGASTWVDLN